MLKRARHKLRMIRYYSAARPRTVWTRATDIAFVASLVLALPITCLSNLAVIRPVTAIDLSGSLYREPDSSFHAVLLSQQNSRVHSIAGEPCGNFQLRVEDHLHGWPLTTSVERQPMRIDVDIFAEVKPRENIQLAQDDPLRIAITEALDRDQQSDARMAFQDPQARTRQHWLAWLPAIALWWIMLVLGSSMLISFAKFGSLVWKGRTAVRRAQLRAQGKCLVCGYDMTGLEFNERCPECGELVW